MALIELINGFWSHVGIKIGQYWYYRDVWGGNIKNDWSHWEFA